MTAILYVQKALQAAGYAPGPLDGLWGAKTKAALDAALAKDGGGELSPEPVTADPIVASEPKASRPITEIVVHCTATPEGRDVSVETIRGWHKAKGWSDIGYHFVVALDGTVRRGRAEASVGAHVAGHNTGTLGVVYVGGCDTKMQPKDTRTPAQTAALMAVCKALIAKYPTIRKVSGHNEYDAGKACPSFDVRKDPLGALV